MSSRRLSVAPPFEAPADRGVGMTVRVAEDDPTLADMSGHWTVSLTVALYVMRVFTGYAHRSARPCVTSAYLQLHLPEPWVRRLMRSVGHARPPSAAAAAWGAAPPCPPWRSPTRRRSDVRAGVW
eukprot:7307141-Prymnesium_polylepis.1